MRLQERISGILSVVGSIAPSPRKKKVFGNMIPPHGGNTLRQRMYQKIEFWTSRSYVLPACSHHSYRGSGWRILFDCWILVFRAALQSVSRKFESCVPAISLEETRKGMIFNLCVVFSVQLLFHIFTTFQLWEVLKVVKNPFSNRNRNRRKRNW